MSIEAFWSIAFQSNQDGGFGVVIFESGRVFGGDSCFYYNGNYVVTNGDIKAKVRVKRFAPGLPSLVGLDDYTLIVERLGKGSISSNEFMIEGYVDADPQTQVYVGFSRIENLP